jgi:hypothetical protein
MPKLPIDYSKACIYEIVCKDVNVTQRYIGSTTNLTQRRYLHKSVCHNEKARGHNYYVYQFIRENGGFVNWSVVLVEALPDCKDKKSLSKSERKWVDKTRSELNTNIPSRNGKEYRKENYKENKEKRKQAEHKERQYVYNKRYKDKNRSRYNEHQRKYMADKKTEKILGVLCVFLAGRAFLAGARGFGGNIDLPLFQNRG